MKQQLTVRSLVLAAAVLAASACQKASQPSPEAAAPATPSTTVAQTAPQAVPNVDAPAAAPKVQVCTLLSAAEMSALMGKTLIQDGCSYGLDPAPKEKEMAEIKQAPKPPAAGDMGSFVKEMMQKQQKATDAIGNQMTISVDASRDNQTEEEVKSIYAKTGGTVRGAIAPLHPEQRGLNGLIQGLDEVNGVGDWAFATNVASVNMGMGFSIRGRILEARKGPWHVTVSATVAPDPGSAALDNQLAGVARALIAKL
jgi:hypothetical protein